MMARRSWSDGVFQSSFSKRTRPSGLASTSTASIASTYRRIVIADCGMRIAESSLIFGIRECAEVVAHPIDNQSAIRNSNAGCGRRAGGIVDAQDDRRGGTAFGSAAVRVFDVDVRVAD